MNVLSRWYEKHMTHSVADSLRNKYDLDAFADEVLFDGQRRWVITVIDGGSTNHYLRINGHMTEVDVDGLPS